MDDDVAPHDGRVNALAIDERTRYLFSADALGEIFVWRLDAQSKYELLRKFKREVGYTTYRPHSISLYIHILHLQCTLPMHPDNLRLY